MTKFMSHAGICRPPCHAPGADLHGRGDRLSARFLWFEEQSQNSGGRESDPEKGERIFGIPTFSSHYGDAKHEDLLWWARYVGWCWETPRGYFWGGYPKATGTVVQKKFPGDTRLKSICAYDAYVAWIISNISHWFMSVFTPTTVQNQTSQWYVSPGTCRFQRPSTNSGKKAAPAGQLCSRCSKRLASTRTMVGGIWKLSDGHVSCLYWYIYQTLFHQSSDPEKVYCEPKWQVGVQNHLGVHLLFSVFRSPKKSFAGWLCQAGHSAGGEAGDGQNEMLGWMGQWG